MPVSGFGAVILQYHHISSETPPITSISPKDFLQHMSYLRTHDFKIESLPKLMEKIRNKQLIADKTIVITFDDGYDSVYLNARPILKQFGWPYTVFINPKFVDDKYKRHMTWPQLNEIAKEGATLANHTMLHDYLARKPKDITPKHWLDKIQADVELAESRIKAETGQNHKMLAYPYGEFDLSIQNRLKNMGFIAFGQHSGAVGHHTDLTRIPRFPAAGIYANMETLKLKMQSLPFSILALDNANPVIDVNPPALSVNLKIADFHTSNVQCFAPGSTRADVQWSAGNQFTVTSPQPLPQERSRYNCTAPSIAKPGRFYWFSQPWVNLMGAGENRGENP
jgi:peptidoglycan/xylan/chitin deacetylase (PgdA/CDA1 family)